MDAPLTVSQFNDRITSLISYSDAVRDIEMVGEISECKRATSGHFYLTLKDAKSTVKCTLFRSAAARVGFEPKAGMKVSVFGSASYYAAGGSLSFNVEGMKPYGKGEQQEALEKLKLRLMEEGLFDNDKKRPLPRYPRTIGVVTSPTGAVIKDIIDTTARRFPVNILLSPATVQGTDAPESIVRAIERLNRCDVDVIIVGRGGGSADDLSAFNDESVVRALRSTKAPVISAVGHATDKSLTDLAADKYAETPTAAAMLATPDRAEESRYLRILVQKMNQSLLQTLDRMRSRFETLDVRLSPKTAKDAVDVYDAKLSRLSVQSDMIIQRRLSESKGRLSLCEGRLDPKRFAERLNTGMMAFDSLSDRLDMAFEHSIALKSASLDLLSGRLDSINPNTVLERGYSFITDSEGSVIKSVKGLEAGMDITITMKDGRAAAKVKETRTDGQIN